MPNQTTLQGTVAPGFESVRNAFAAAIAREPADHAAQLAAYLHGSLVVDLWAGMAGDALTGVFSSTKGAAYMVVALLAQDGILDLDQRVAHYWPEFAAHAKQDITLRDLLAHRAGVPGADAGFALQEGADDRVIAARLAGQHPFWRPGSAFGYHGLSIGALAGEVVFRATGHTLHAIYEERIRAPHALDFHLGLPEALEPRFLTTLPMLPTPAQQAELDAAAMGPHSLHAITYNRHLPGAPELWTLPNHRVVREKGPSSVGGVGSARGLAGMYAAAISGLDGQKPLLTPQTAASFGQIQSIGMNLINRMPAVFAVGFQATDHAYPVLGQGAFGHGGAAGSQAFADPRSGLAYGYARRRFAFPGGAAPENLVLVKAVHDAATALR
jgi:CubicO group peptidase (beta-lactamase class C family)